MVWIGSVRCEKFRHDFVARTFALIALVWRVLQLVWCRSETVPNAPKRKETHQNMRLWSNGLDWKRLLWKILTRHHGTKFCINCTNLACFRATAKWSQMLPNGKKCTKTWVYGPMVWIVSIRCEKLWHDFVSQTFTLIALVWRVLDQVSGSSKMVTNAPKWNEMHQNMSLGSDGVDRER
jgi:hypothetical protein